jgi:hypothetical protein
MTNTVNNKVTSPVLEHGQGHIFHSAGANFKITGSHIETITETNDLFQTLVAANKVFDINETGVSFYYDYNRKRSITKIEEGSVKNFGQFLELHDKLDFLKESAKNIRLSGNKGAALSKVNKEIEDTGMLIAESKDKSLVIEFRYVAESNTFFAGNIEIPIDSNESLAERFFTIGYIKYADKSLLEAFQIAAKNFKSFKVLDFVVESKSNQITVATMRAESNAFVYRVNEETKISKFKKMLASAAIQYVAENTGADVTEQFSDLLEEANRVLEMKNEKISLYKEMLAFLYDQRGRLAEADRNLPDIKAADNLIETEISKLKEEISILEEETLSIEDGYVNATTKGEVEGLPEGAALKVDAVEFNQAGKNDILTVFVENKPFRLEKYKINISEEDNI